MVNIFLDYRVDEAGNIAVVINIFTDLRGADVLQLLRELQLHDFSDDLLVNFRRMCLSRTAEDNMVEGMDGIFFRFLLVGACVVDNVGSHNDIEFLRREHLSQATQIRRVRDVDRRVVREQMDIKLVRDGHVYDLAAHQVRLGLFRPGELVDGEEYGESKLLDLLRDLLVGQCERVEGSREERNFVPRHGLHLAAE